MVATTQNKPDDFDTFWGQVLEELAAVDAAPEVDRVPIRDTDYATMYSVRLTSIGPYRLFAYLSIPTGTPPFPAIYYVPGYSSVVQTIPQGTANQIRGRYVTFSLGVRGQRNVDKPFTGDFPGMLTEGVDDPSSYVFRGIVADCIRGLEYLVSRPEVNPLRVLADGNDVAMLMAGLEQSLTHAVYSPGPYYAAAELAPATSAYPLEEVNDYLRLYPEKREQVLHTLSYFDPRWVSQNVLTRTLVMGGAESEPLDTRGVHAFLEALGERAEFHPTEHSSYKDGLFVQRWLTREMGFDTPILPEHWQ